jgi:hypothetical protein
MHVRESVRVNNESEDFAQEDNRYRRDSTPSLRGELTASCLCYLFADLFVPSLSRWSRFRGVPGVVVPSSDSLVAIGFLEAELLAIAQWDLRAQGHLDISEESPEDRRFLRSRRDAFYFRFTPHGVGSIRTGLEAEILRALDDSPCDLYALINDRWTVGDKTLAINGVLVFAQREALSRGLLRARPAETGLPKSLQWSSSLPCYIGDSAAREHFADPAAQLAEDVLHLENSKDWEWKALMREAERTLFHARPYFHFEGGGGEGG